MAKQLKMLVGFLHYVMSNWPWAAALWMLLKIRKALAQPRIVLGNVLCKPGKRHEGLCASLSHGKCHYVLDGDHSDANRAKRPLVVLVHGFVGSSSYFEPLAKHLVNAHGQRVLRLDLYGRGYSEDRGAPQTAELFAGQLAELLFSLGEVSPVHLLGYSMGGLIAARFASVYPERIQSLTLVASSGLPSMQSAMPWGLGVILRIPGMQTVVGRYLTHSMMKRRALFASEWADPAGPRFERQLSIQTERMDAEPALPQAAGSCLAHMRWCEMRDEFIAIAAAAFPVLVVWGAEDRIVPAKGADEIVEMVPRAKVRIFPRYGHSVPIEAAEKVSEAMVAAWEEWGVLYGCVACAV